MDQGWFKQISYLKQGKLKKLVSAFATIIITVVIAIATTRLNKGMLDLIAEVVISKENAGLMQIRNHLIMRNGDGTFASTEVVNFAITVTGITEGSS